MQTKTCNVCGHTLPEDEFYNLKNVCMDCYKRKARMQKRILSGTPIKTVKELVRELISLPQDAEVMLSDNIAFYKPSTVEFIRTEFKDNEDFDTDKYNNVVVII